MNFLNQALTYIFTASNWGGKAGLGARILEHHSSVDPELHMAVTPVETHARVV